MRTDDFRLVQEQSCATDEQGHCLTCSDSLETLIVTHVTPETGLALATGPQGSVEIDISLLESVTPGRALLVHGGVALAFAENA
jgi:hypothetical protein